MFEKGNKQEALKTYLEVVEKHAESSPAPQALYNATFTLLDLDQHAETVTRATGSCPIGGICINLKCILGDGTNDQPSSAI